MRFGFHLPWAARRPFAGFGACLIGVLGLALPGFSQTGSAPLPDVPTLIQQVLAHQRQMEAVQENYTFHETDLTHELNKDGSVKKTESEEYEVFFVNTHPVRQLIRKDGKDLNPDQQKKEQDRIAKDVEKAQQTPPGQSPRGDQSISVSNILSMAKVSQPRRVTLDGRSTIAFDFTGNPKARAHNIAEEAALRTYGTIWIDEKDRQVRRLVATLGSNVHAGFGLLSLSKGSNLTFDQRLVNNELWLPTSADIHLVAHAIGILGFRAQIHMTDDGYRKFHAEAQQQSGSTVAQPAPQ
ncbi:MAG: hypothetical protein WA399_04730 [Acidobacteriaceae bacterium]